MMHKLRLSCTVALAVAASSLTARAAGTVSVYLSSPFAQTATAAGYTGTTNATFDAATTVTYTTNYVSAIGTFAPASGGNFALNANTQYGGGGQGGYLAVMPPTPAANPTSGGTVTLTLTNAVGFLSLEWCAIDGGNQLTFLDAAGNTIGSFNAATINNYLTAHPTVNVGGTSYTNTQYKAQPNADGTTKSTTNNTGENYGYVSFIAGSGTAIKTVQLSETGATFESDNWSILTTAPAPAGASVLIAVVPEPSAWALCGLAGLTVLAVALRRRRRAA